MDVSAWKTTCTLSVGQLLSWGILYYSFAVCLPFMQADLGWSSTKLSTGFSLALLVSGVLAPVFGAWADQYGTRRIMFAGSLLGVVGMVLWSRATVFPVYLVAWLFLGAAMATTLYEMAFATVVHAHPKARQKSIVTITLVGALASPLFLPLAGTMFTELGWRFGLLVLALGFGVGTLPLHASLPRCKLREPVAFSAPEERAVHFDARARAFWLLGVALMLASVVSVIFTTYIVVLLIEKGQSVQTAAAIAGVAGLAKLAGRSVMAIQHRFSTTRLLQASLLLQGAALLLPVFAPSLATLLLMIVAFGATGGARTILRPLLVVEMFGQARFGIHNGRLQAMATLAKSAAPIGAGLWLGISGFDGTWLVLALLAGISGLLLFFLPVGSRGGLSGEAS